VLSDMQAELAGRLEQLAALQAHAAALAERLDEVERRAEAEREAAGVERERLAGAAGGERPR
jgi:hypothetical protein